MDPAAATIAVDEVARLLRADGADLVVVEIDPKTLRVRLALEYDDVRCAECILGPDELERTVGDAIGRRVAGEFELLLDDPRRATP
jgi:hypothetical protein